MKKWIGMVAAAAMVLTLGTASAAVPSKTTTDIANKAEVVDATGSQVSASFVVEQTGDKAPVVEEIVRISEAVNVQGKAPVEYFPAEVQTAVAAKLPEVADIKTLEMNEFISITATGYDTLFGDVTVAFDVVSTYKPGQKVVALVGVYSGARDANGEYIVEWIPMNAEVTSDGRIQIAFTADVLAKIQNAAATSLAVLSEPV